MSIFSECCVLPAKSLCDRPIPSPEESYRLWCHYVPSRNLKNETALAQVGHLRQREKKVQYCFGLKDKSRHFDTCGSHGGDSED